MYVWNLIMKLSSLSTPRGRMVHACTPRSVEGGANNTPCHQAPRQVHATTAHVSKAFPRSPRGANSGRTCTTSSGDGGGLKRIPPSTKYSHATLRHTSPPREPFNKSWLNNQAILADHALCLSAEAYIQTRTYRYYTLNQRKARRAAPSMSGKSRQHAACRSLETALCSPGRPILDHLLSIHRRHAKTSTGMILACWRPRWRPRGGWGSNVQWRHLSRWTAHGAQHAPVAWPPFTFGRPLPARCWAPKYVLLFQPRGPPATGPITCRQESCHPGGPPWGQLVSGVRPPSTFGRILRPGSSSPTCTCRTRSCWCRWWRGRSPWRTNQAVMLPSSSQILATRPVVTISLSTSNLMCQVPPTSSYCARRQSEWSHSRPRSGLLTWHPSASTADSLLLLRYY
jgi:hypothetical protein